MTRTTTTIILLVFGAIMLRPAWAQEFSADWVGFDGEETHTLARVMRSQHWMRVELSGSAGDDGSAAARSQAFPEAGAEQFLLGDRRVGLGVWVSEAARSQRRDVLPAPLAMKWPLREPAQLRCEDPAWRCSQLESLQVEGRELTVWRLQHFERGVWRESMLWQSADATVVWREQWPEGRSVQLLEDEWREHQGRKVRVQQYLITDRAGNRWHSRYWYDPSLDQVVREDLPDGGSRWLQNIRVEAQPPELFAPPAQGPLTGVPGKGPLGQGVPGEVGAATGPPGASQDGPAGLPGMGAYFDPTMPPPPGLAEEQVE